MTMYAIYHIDPKTKIVRACISSGHMIFSEKLDPALFVTAKNANDALRTYLKYCRAGTMGSDSYASVFHGTYLEKPLDPTLSNFKIVPVTITPNFEHAVGFVPPNTSKNGGSSKRD